MRGNLGLLKIVRFTGIILKGPFKQLFVSSYFSFENVRRIRHPSRKKRVLEEEENIGRSAKTAVGEGGGGYKII